MMQTQKDWRAIAMPAVILLITVGSYIKTFHAPFIFDDYTAIVQNGALHNLGSFLSLDAFLKNRYVGELSFALNYAANGLQVAGYHLVNLIIHLFTVLLVYRLVALTLRTPAFPEEGVHKQFPFSLLPFFAALLFAVHPVQTQAITYIVQRFTSLATLFYLLAFVIYVQARLDGRKPFSFQYLLATVAGVLAMKTKEIAFTLPFMLIAYDLCFFKGPPRERMRLLAPLAATVLVIPLSMLFTQHSSGGVAGYLLRASAETSAIPRSYYLFTQFGVIATYLRLLFLPINQQLDYETRVYTSLTQYQVYLPLLLHLALLGTAAYIFYRGRKSGNGLLLLAAFGMFWFYVTLSVESSVIPIRDVIFEHRVYLPSVGALTAIVALLMLAATNLRARLPSGPNLIVALLALSSLALTGTTYARNHIWQEPGGIYKDNVEKNPDQDRARLNLGYYYMLHNKNNEAQEEYEAAIRLNPNNFQAYRALGQLLQSEQKNDEALKNFEKALSLKPYDAESYLGAGIIYGIKGNLEKSEIFLSNALKLTPNDVEAQYNLAIVYHKQKKYQQAIDYYKKALGNAPNNYNIYNNIGIAYMQLGNYHDAILYFQEAVKLDGTRADAKNNLNAATMVSKNPKLGFKLK